MFTSFAVDPFFFSFICDFFLFACIYIRFSLKGNSTMDCVCDCNMKKINKQMNKLQTQIFIFCANIYIVIFNGIKTYISVIDFHIYIFNIRIRFGGS